MTGQALADRAFSFLQARGYQRALTDVHIVLGQSNAAAATPAPNLIPFATTPGIAYGVLSAPRPDYTLSGPFANGDVPTPGWGQSSWSPHFAQAWFNTTGRRSIWKLLAVAGQCLVPSSDPTTPQLWSVADPSKSLAGTYTYSAGGENKPRNELWRDVYRTVKLNPYFQQSIIFAHWVQGEADANAFALGRLTQADYERELNMLIDYVKIQYGVDYFLIHELGRKGTDATQVAANEATGYTQIRAAQNNVAAARDDTLIVFNRAKELGSPFNTLTVNPDFTWVAGMSYQNDGVHLNSEAYRTMGRTAAVNTAIALGLA